MTITLDSCPRCANRRTVRSGWGAFCFNCRFAFDSRTGSEVAPAPHPFSPAELLRLERYRSAIHNGLFTDWPATLDAPQPLALD